MTRPFLLGLLALAGAANAAVLDVEVRDASGAPVPDAVAYAVPRGAPAPTRKREAVIEQVDRQFVPFVTAVQVGTAVQFPNRDSIRHHVYSFSPPKPFELKLYAGTPAAPVVFDKPGEIVLGCNIHDHMIAYVLAVETPWFSKTGREGRARIEGLPAGEYDVKVWHPHLGAMAPEPRAVRLRADETGTARWSLALRPMPPRPAAAPPYPSQ